MFCLFYYCLKLMWVDREFRNNVSKHICLSYDSNICTSVISVVHSIQQRHSRLWFCQCQIMSVCFTFSCWSNRCGSMFVMCALFWRSRGNWESMSWLKSEQNIWWTVTYIAIIFKGSQILLHYTLADCVIVDSLLFDWLMRFLGV